MYIKKVFPDSVEFEDGTDYNWRSADGPRSTRKTENKPLLLPLSSSPESTPQRRHYPPSMASSSKTVAILPTPNTLEESWNLLREGTDQMMTRPDEGMTYAKYMQLYTFVIRRK